MDGTGRITNRNRRFLRQYTLPGSPNTTYGSPAANLPIAEKTIPLSQNIEMDTGFAPTVSPPVSSKPQLTTLVSQPASVVEQGPSEEVPDVAEPCLNANPSHQPTSVPVVPASTTNSRPTRLKKQTRFYDAASGKWI